MPDLCRDCGHALPNAVGPGVYCTNCGTPVNPPQRTMAQRIDATIARIRRDDSDFITPDTIRAYTGCTTAQARHGIVRAFGQDWLDRQDRAASGAPHAC